MALISNFKCFLKCRPQFVSSWTSLKLCRLLMDKEAFESETTSDWLNVWFSQSEVVMFSQ